MEKKEQKQMQRPVSPMASRGRQKNPHNAMETARAVLSVWTEHRKGSEICQELNIQWGILQMWQNRAMEGMLQALEPRVNLEKGPALSPKLQQMLERRQHSLIKLKTPAENKLEERLIKVQESRKNKKEKPVKK